MVHELRITNQLMYLSPSVEEARCELHSELNAWQAHILMLPRIQHSRYQVGVSYCTY